MRATGSQVREGLGMSMYWKCQILGWSFYGFLAGGIPTLYGGFRWMVLVRAGVGILLGLGLTELLRRHMRRHGWTGLPLSRLAPRVAAASFALAAVMVLMLLPLLRVILTSSERAGPLAAIFSIHLIIALGWILLYLGYHNLHRVQRAEREKWRLELAMRDRELGALRSQLNPHFLFNSLNSLRALVVEDPARAQESVTALAALLRHTLRMSRSRTTTLEEELDATRNYLALESIRFDSRLRYEISADPEVLGHRVPPMLVQTLAENGIKHGVALRPEGGYVHIDVARKSGDLHIRVRNTGTLSGDPRKRGVGLANSLERLRLIFGDGVSLQLRVSGPDEVTCETVIPAAVVRSTGVPGIREKAGAP